MDTPLHTASERLYQGKDLTQDQSHALFSAIVSGDIDPIILSSWLTALKIKGETPEEIAGAAYAMREHATHFPTPDYDFADIVGTGGDGANTINISTLSAIVAACCDVKVAKHGNRSVSSQTGSSDLLQAFGIDLAMSPNQARQALDDLGLCFLFAPQYHPGVRHAMPVRQTLKTRTLFNILGPLINPAKPTRQLLGVYDPNLLSPMAESLRHLNLQEAIIVHGDGLDEVAIHGETQIIRLKNGQHQYSRLCPEDFGLKRHPLSAIQGGAPEENRQISERLLQGHGTEAQISAVAMNVALLLSLFGKNNLKDNTEQARSVIQSGVAFDRLIALSKRGHE